MVASDQLVFIFGVLGNIVSFCVFLSPLPTFYKIYQEKTSQGYQSFPYVVALLSALLLLYYGFLKTNATLIISINCIGIAIESLYLLTYLFYAPRALKITTLIWILIVDVGGIGLTIFVTFFVLKGLIRIQVVGWICAIFSIAVFASPLSIMCRVIRTRSVEYMPFALSFFLTICATLWFLYGLFDNDFYIMVPNVLGFLFGIAQMILYFIYSNASPPANSAQIQL